LVIVIAANFAHLPYPIALDWDSSYIAFFSIADYLGLVAGDDYIFTYGPLASWYLPVDFSRSLLFGMILRAVTALVVLLFMMSVTTPLIALLYSFGVTYLILLEPNASIVSIGLVLSLSVARRNAPMMLISVGVLTVWGLVKFTGIVTLYLALSYSFAIALVVNKNRATSLIHLIAASFSHVFLVIILYVIYLEQSPLHFFDYSYWSLEIANGYSQFMSVGSRRWSLIGFLTACAALFAWHLWTLRPTQPVTTPGPSNTVWVTNLDWRMVAIASLATPALFLALKQGYTRQDGHETSAYVVAFVYATFIACGSRLPARVLIPGQMTLAVMVAIGVHATMTGDIRTGAGYFANLTSSLWSRAASVLLLVDPDHRREAANTVLERNRSALAELQRVMPLMEQLKAYDIFAPEQALVTLNPDAYRPRPVFQGYSAYTAKLQDLNARHAERVPEEYLVRFAVADRRYPNLDDGSTLAQIALQFCPVKWYGGHVVARRTRPPIELDALHALAWRSENLISGASVDMPDGVVLGQVRVELSLLGRLAAAAYRLPALVARFELSDGRVNFARIIPTGGEYPAILSPWLESSSELVKLWKGESGAAVRRIQLQTSPILRLLFKEVAIRQAPYDWGSVVLKCAAVPGATETPPGALLYEFPEGSTRLQAIDAHPNRSVAVPVLPLPHLKVTLRLRSPAVSATKSDGVQVRIYGFQQGEKRPLLDRRVTAQEIASGSIEVFNGETDLSGGYVVLETSDRDPTWDWFEWGNIEFR